MTGIAHTNDETQSNKKIEQLQKYICKAENEGNKVLKMFIIVVLGILFYIIPFIYIVITLVLMIDYFTRAAKINDGRFYGDYNVILEANNIQQTVGNIYVNDYIITLFNSCIKCVTQNPSY